MTELHREILLAEEYPSYYAAGIDAARVFAKSFAPQPSSTITSADAKAVLNVVRQRIIAGSGEEKFFSDASAIVNPASEEQQEALVAGALIGHIEVAKEQEEGRISA